MALDNPNFNVLAPLPVTATELISGIPDAENQVYNAGTAYATGDLVWHAGKVFRSKVNGNTGNTPTEGANWSDLGETDQGALEYDAGATYAVGDYAVYQGALWQSASNGNTGNTPTTAETDWTRIGATNRFKPFDTFLQDEANLPGGIPFVLEFADLVTSIAILRASGTSVTVTMTDETEGEVYNQTIPLIDDSAIVDWWEYFFAPIVQSDTVLIEQLPPYAGAEIAITLDGDDVSIGQIVAGAQVTFGVVVVGSGVGLDDYSVKERDDFNRFFVAERPYSDTNAFTIRLSSIQAGYARRQLALRRAKPTLFYMSGGAPYGLVTYGFFKDFDIFHSTPVIAEWALEIEGLG